MIIIILSLINTSIFAYKLLFNFTDGGSILRKSYKIIVTIYLIFFNLQLLFDNDDGFIYDVDKIWDLKGQIYPPDIKETVKKLYDSENIKDKYFALIASYSLLDITSAIRFQFDQSVLFEVWIFFFFLRN